ncbi:ankyrin repeat domain-containing protein [Candidatus Latescibacterota bacterium]
MKKYFCMLIAFLYLITIFPFSLYAEDISPLFQDFHIAALTKDEKTIRKILIDNPELKNMRGRNGGSLYHYVIFGEQFAILRILFEEKVPLGIRDNDGNTPLLMAIKYNNSEVVRLMLENNADPEKKNGDGARPLEIALENGFYYIADMLIEKGSEISIHCAALLGLTDNVISLLKDKPSLVNSKNHEGKTPLHLLCNRTNDTSINLNMNMNKKSNDDRFGWREKAFLEIIEILLDNGADINKRDKDGWTPLHYAVKNALHREAELLLKRGASVNATLDDGDTPLHIAAWNSRELTAMKLIEHEADINAVNSFGATPLSWANVQGNSSIIELLKSNGADEASEKLDKNKTWKLFLKSFHSEKALSAHLLALGSSEIADLDIWFINIALRINRKNSKDYRCIEIFQGNLSRRISGKIIVFDSEGNIIKTLAERYQSIDRSLLFPKYNSLTDSKALMNLYNSEKWTDLTDVNGDGFGDIPTTIMGRTRKIYSSHSNDLPVIFEAEINFRRDTKWPFEDIESGRLLLQYVDKPSPGLRMAVLPVTGVTVNQNQLMTVSDINNPPRELARYEWDTKKNAFVGPRSGIDNLWTIKFPVMTDDANSKRK